MENIKKNFGFGCMRLPMKDGEVDTEQTCRMVDAFLENGFNYFDTAHGYLDGKSETALKTCLTSRYPRDRYILTDKVRDIYHSMNLIPCTACRYCVAGCPKHISIPDLLAVMNTKQIHHDWNADYYYNVVHTGGGKGKASDCIQCGKCEKACPQHLPIRKLLVDVAKEFEK